jgi:hypothetical protein
MRPTLRTRKPIRELTELDINTFPVWEYVIDEEGTGVEDQDETWVRPLRVKQVPRGYSLQVAADLTTASGLELVGIVELHTATRVEVNGAAILSEGRFIVVPDRSRPCVWEVLAEAFGLSEEEVAPLEFVLRVPIEGRKTMRSGVIE